MPPEWAFERVKERGGHQMRGMGGPEGERARFMELYDRVMDGPAQRTGVNTVAPVLGDIDASLDRLRLAVAHARSG